MYRERRRDVAGESAVTARRRVSEPLDVNPATLRGWVERAGGGLGHQAGHDERDGR